MNVKWQIADGYAGSSRPQYTEIDDYSIQECESDEELERLIEECIQDDFEQIVSPSWDMKQALADAKEVQANKEEEE